MDKKGHRSGAMIMIHDMITATTAIVIIIIIITIINDTEDMAKQMKVR